jgi:hypothetical protein
MGARRTPCPFLFVFGSQTDMLNADDQQTVISLRRLKSLVASGTRPLIFWVGAGSSRWLGYDSWKDLTLKLRKEFYACVSGFDNTRALTLVNKGDFPAVFQMCKEQDSARYYRFIADAFAPRTTTDSYQAFVDLLGKMSPLFIVTTNVDEALESRMPMSSVVQRSDLSRCVDLVQRRVPFVAKLHGSISSVESTVFAAADYESLVRDSAYLQALKCMFATCSIVFVGYGVRDSYVLRLLSEDAAERDLFGPGPHFMVTNDAPPVSSLHPIRYQIKLHPDHRAALSVLDHIRQSAAPNEVATPAAPQLAPSVSADNSAGAVPPGKTAYYISDLIPPGTWRTSQEITAVGGAGEIEVSFGLGFTNDEIPFRESTALHDFVVGLTCFDYVYLPFFALGPLHTLLGSEFFWEFVQAGVLVFIHSEAQIGVLFRKGETIGDVGNVIGGSKEGPQPTPLAQLIRNTLSPAPGKEAQAERLFDQLERRTAVYKRAVEINLPSLVRSALLMPAVSKLLGIGDAILPTQAPRWLRFPYLRLAHLVQTAALCTEYGIQAAKIPFGGVQLTSAAFGVQPAGLQADHLASYVSVGSYNSDLGALIHSDMSILRRILHFRGSAEGESFRREIGQVLATEAGREFNASVNAGLSKTIPVAVLQRAQDRLLKLMSESARITPVPAVWGSTTQSDTSTRYWRAKSQKILLEMCEARGIGKNDPCICDSGEKLRLCCLPPLRQ